MPNAYMDDKVLVSALSLSKPFTSTRKRLHLPSTTTLGVRHAEFHGASGLALSDQDGTLKKTQAYAKKI